MCRSEIEVQIVRQAAVGTVNPRNIKRTAIDETKTGIVNQIRPAIVKKKAERHEGVARQLGIHRFRKHAAIVSMSPVCDQLASDRFRAPAGKPPRGLEPLT